MTRERKKSVGARFWLSMVFVSFCDNALAYCPARCQCDLIHVPRSIGCSRRGLQVFPENVSDVVEHLDLSGNLLTELPTDVNRLTELLRLNLAGNKLSSLPRDLRGLGNLRWLDLSENAILATGLGAIGQLAHLRTLCLAGNPIRELDELRNVALQYLKADDCGIEMLKNTSLSGLPELTHLSLSNNPLNDIKDPYSSKLEWLDLSKCQLKVLSPNTFQGFPELIDLRLADNPMLVYSTRYETVRHPKLKILDVSGCNLDRPGLHGFPSLTQAQLSNNDIRLLPDRIFAKNRELTHLYLGYNHLERLNKSSFAYLLKLQFLDLSANGLKSIPSAIFRDNKELKTLNLSDNYLTEIPRLSSSVITLDLSENLINHIEPNMLAGYRRLNHLDLSKNLIEEIVSGWDSLSLKTLILKRNRITHVENISLSNLPELQKLDLSGNLLTRGINPEIFFDTPNLRYLYLQDNPWKCDCAQLYQFYNFLLSLSLTNSLICHTPTNVTGYSWKVACATKWKNQNLLKSNNKTWGLVLVTLLTIVVLSGTIVSIRHSMKLKRQARNQRLELERAEVRERLRLLHRRSMRLQEELREHSAEPRINPLELVGPPTYEEAVTMQRLARSLDTLDSVNDVSGTNITHMTCSSESLRVSKKRRPRRVRRLRSQSEGNLTRREVRREERLRRAREDSSGVPDENTQVEDETEERNKSSKTRIRPPTPTASRRRSRRISTRNGTSTDDEDSEALGNGSVASGTRINRTIIRNLDKEPRSGYRPSTDGDS